MFVQGCPYTMDEYLTVDGIKARLGVEVVTEAMHAESAREYRRILLSGLADSTTTFRSWGRGGEGICQKLWTIVTLAVVRVAATRAGFKAEIMGQGDNQNVVLYIPVPHDCELHEAPVKHAARLKMAAKEFMRHLVDVAGGVGLEIKQSETWFAIMTAVYGKIFVYRGGLLGMGLKHGTKACEETNAIIHSIDSRIGGIWASAQTAASTTVTPGVFYTLAAGRSFAAAVLITELGLRKSTGERVECRIVEKPVGDFNKRNLMMHQSALWHLFHTSALGGLPVQPPIRFMYRGHPDALTEALACLEAASNTIPFVRIMYHLITNQTICEVQPGGATVGAMVENPDAVKYLGIGSADGLLKHRIRESVGRIPMTNQDFEGLKAAIAPGADSAMLRNLQKIKPCNPRLLSLIYDRTSHGAAKTSLNKFSSPSTLYVLVPGMGALEVAVHDMECNNARARRVWFMKVITCTGEGLQNRVGCSTELAIALRRKYFAERIVGVTTPHPLVQAKMIICRPWDPIPLDQAHISVSFNFVPHALAVPASPIFVRGTRTPYMGSTTSSKIVAGSIVQGGINDKPFAACMATDIGWVCFNLSVF
eukprot:GHVR01149111.1.p1 GENE.GHVR01149111.1~~GHVR01149111.1.p1  ORF type:complete len:593 (+),score=75.81 GHVR01149111.1:125-1903(+)